MSLYCRQIDDDRKLNWCSGSSRTPEKDHKFATVINGQGNVGLGARGIDVLVLRNTNATAGLIHIPNAPRHNADPTNPFLKLVTPLKYALYLLLLLSLEQDIHWRRPNPLALGMALPPPYCSAFAYRRLLCMIGVIKLGRRCSRPNCNKIEMYTISDGAKRVDVIPFNALDESQTIEAESSEWRWRQRARP